MIPIESYHKHILNIFEDEKHQAEPELKKSTMLKYIKKLGKSTQRK